MILAQSLFRESCHFEQFKKIETRSFLLAHKRDTHCFNFFQLLKVTALPTQTSRYKVILEHFSKQV